MAQLINVINYHTYLTSNDWWPHYKQHQLVEEQVKESNHWLQLGGVERCNAGLELGLQVVLHDAHVSYPDWEHMLVQSMYQGEELIQVLVLERERGRGAKERRE